MGKEETRCEKARLEIGEREAYIVRKYSWLKLRLVRHYKMWGVWMSGSYKDWCQAGRCVTLRTSSAFSLSQFDQMLKIYRWQLFGSEKNYVLHASFCLTVSGKVGRFYKKEAGWLPGCYMWEPVPASARNVPIVSNTASLSVNRFNMIIRDAIIRNLLFLLQTIGIDSKTVWGF